MTGGMLDSTQVIEVLRSLTHDLEAAKECLTELDSAIGDGDLGITFSRGGRGIREGLQGEPADIGQMLIKAGLDFSNAAGSTMGALLGTAFVQAGKEVRGQAKVDLADIARMVEAAVQGVQARGKAHVGDKTMLDAMVPASVALTEAVSHHTSLLEGLEQALAAAEQGMQATTSMQAAFGRARWLGDRTIGHQDPGATAVYLIFRSAAESLRRLPGFAS